MEDVQNTEVRAPETVFRKPQVHFIEVIIFIVENVAWFCDCIQLNTETFKATSFKENIDLAFD